MMPSAISSLIGTAPVPLLPPTSHPVLRDPTQPFKSSKRSNKSKATIHTDGTRGTKVYHDMNQLSSQVKNVHQGRNHRNGGSRSVAIGRKNKWDGKGKLVMEKLKQSHIDSHDIFDRCGGQPQQQQPLQPPLQNYPTKKTPSSSHCPRKKSKQATSQEDEKPKTHHHHQHIKRNVNAGQQSLSKDEFNDIHIHIGDIGAALEDHEDENNSEPQSETDEIDHEQNYYDYRSFSHSPLPDIQSNLIREDSPEVTIDMLSQEEEKSTSPAAAAVTTPPVAMSPLPLCPPRHGSKKYLYEYEALNIETGMIRLPRWIGSNRKNRLETLLSERFGKRYPWRKQTQLPGYNRKLYADVF